MQNAEGKSIIIKGREGFSSFKLCDVYGMLIFQSVMNFNRPVVHALPGASRAITRALASLQKSNLDLGEKRLGATMLLFQLILSWYRIKTRHLKQFS